MTTLLVRPLDKTTLGDALDFPDLDIEVKSINYSTIGGPLRAQLEASGTIFELWRLFSFLRNGIEIYDQMGVTCWWGYINEVQISMQSVEYGLNLERMANSVAVEYSTEGAGQPGAGSFARTGFAENAESIAEFGRKQIIVSSTENSKTSAEAFRDKALEELKGGIPEIRLQQSSEVKATLLCNGWIQTLEWIYWIASNTRETSGVDNPIGLTHTAGVAFRNGTTERAGQTLTISATENYVPVRIHVWLKKTGAPGDVTASLYTVSGGLPDTLIASNTLLASSISVSFTPYIFTLSTSTEVAASTSYWIELTAASGDATNYYEVGVNENAPYLGGQFYTHDGVVWSADSTKDAVFILSGERNTDTQLANLLDDADAGQFLGSHEIPTTGLLMSARNQSGNMTALEVLEEMLEQGTVNNRRLIMEVLRSRDIIITEEPTTGSNYYLNSNMTLETETGVPIPRHHVHRQVGIWVTPKDLIPLIGQQVTFQDMLNIPVVEAEYNALRDELRLRTRNSRDILDLVRFGP